MNLSRFAIALLALCAACQPETRTLEAGDFGFDGSCVNCHTGLSAAQVHPTFKLRCVDCHGGDDQVAVPQDAFDDEDTFRDPDLIKAAHVRPKEGLARFFYANGIDDDDDGEVDEGPTFDDAANPTQVIDFGEIAEPGLHGEGMGEFLDAELNRDLNYTRWLNPGDLRVATIGCGSSSRPALDGEAGGGCHQGVVEHQRRSIMVNQAAVLNGAYYGNESWRADFFEQRDINGPAADPRAGAFGYVLNFDAIDGCIVDDAPTSEGGDDRAQPRFDSDCLEEAAGAADPAAATGGAGNVGLPPFEAAQGTITAIAAPEDGTLPHVAANDSRYTWGGKPLMVPESSLTQLTAPPEEELVPGVPDPVDNVLRGFRAYYPLNYPGSAVNFNNTFGTSINPEKVDFATNNPFGRGHSSGCTSCHMRNRFDGARDPQKVVEEVDGERVVREVVDPTTKHREFDISQDLVEVDGQDQLVGRAVTAAQRAKTGREQQRIYTAEHRLTTRVDTDQCGQCHGFVTRINMALQGQAEDEQRDKLGRERPIEFTTPQGTDVRILDSWVRQTVVGGAVQEVVIPEGSEIVGLAIERDEDLAAQNLIPGGGGCAQAVFSEDCNNNGELDRDLVLERRNERGEVIATATIDEDLNGNGALDLIDHAPREKSIDGRQMRYVYGGANGSTRQMDVHFERGMHCIDCHMIQDVHGDGHLYSTNWDAIEIECEDCHGARQRATLFTSGPNGGNDLRGAIDHDGRPYFQDTGDRIIQRSRVTPGVFWTVPQLAESLERGLGAEAHSDAHMAPLPPPGGHNTGSTFEGEPGKSKMTSAKLECYSCHSSWVHNCVGCHFNTNLGDLVRNKVNPDGSIVKVAGDNETWFANDNQAAQSNFQLLSLMRSPFVLGSNPTVEGGRLAPFRSSMQVHVSIVDDTNQVLFDNITFTTFQAIDGNSGRTNVATSGVAMNHTLPHTVRPRDTVKGCETCHSLVTDDGKVRNEHVMAETFGIGAGRYQYVGDWAIVAGQGGIELYEHKQEAALGATRFPGIIVDPASRDVANVEPVFDGTGGINAGFVGTDVVLVRNVNVPPAAAGGVPTPTLTDLAIMTASSGNTGVVIATDVTFRGHDQLAPARPSLADADKVFRLALPAAANAIAHLAPDVSDPHLYVANGSAGLTHVTIDREPAPGQATLTLGDSVALPGGRTATEIALAGDIAYVGSAEGTIEVFDLADPAAPEHVATVQAGGAPVNGLVVAGFVLYAATGDGVAAFSLASPLAPGELEGSGGALIVPGINALELNFHGGRLFVAAGADGVIDIDVTTPADPVVNGNLVDLLAPGEVVDARDVAVSIQPVQTWLLIVEGDGDLVGLKLDGSQSVRERCFPDAADCALDMDFRDPTIMGRDPSILGNGQLDPDDPSAPSFFRQASAILGSGTRIARGAVWEQIGTLSGRRLRDSFMPGSGVMSLEVMQRMHAVQVCETDAPGTVGNALNELGYFEDGQCVPLDPAERISTPDPSPPAAGDPAEQASRAAEPICEPVADRAIDTCEPLALAR